MKHAQFRLRELMLGFVALSIVLALARAALVIQIQNREPTAVSVVIQIGAGGLLGLALGLLLVRLLSVRNRPTRNLIFAGCLVTSIPGLAYLVSWLSMTLS